MSWNFSGKVSNDPKFFQVILKISGTLMGQVRKKDPVLGELVPVEQDGE